MIFNAPLSAQRVERLIDLLELPADARCLDIGCGRGELLLRVLVRGGGVGLGVDLDAGCIAAAQGEAVARAVPGAAFRCADAAAVLAEVAGGEGYDLIACVGATHVFGQGRGALERTLAALQLCLRPGGMLLIGETFWEKPPDPAYLETLGGDAGIDRTHAENVACIEAQAGLTVLYAAVSSLDEWDHFEWSHRLRAERAAQAEPTRSEVLARRDRVRAWSRNYLRWGRGTMGFGLYLIGAA